MAVAGIIFRSYSLRSKKGVHPDKDGINKRKKADFAMLVIHMNTIKCTFLQAGGLLSVIRSKEERKSIRI